MSHDPKTTLESLLLDDREERVKRVAALAYFAAKGTMDIATALSGIDREIEAQPNKARESVKAALSQALAWHSIFHGDLCSLTNYVERKGPAKSDGVCASAS